MEHAIKNFENHSSIVAIKNNRNPNKQFSFKPVTKEMVAKEISNLKRGKAVCNSDIPTKIIKHVKDLFATFIYNKYNKSLLDGTFLEDLKTTEVVPVYKKKKRTDKNNYRPVSILSNISKIYERSFYNQMYDYFDSIFSKYQCGFRKGHSPQHCLLYMIEKIKQARDNNNVFAAVLTDLSKAFDCINHELLIAKLNAYGFDSPSLKFISAYLNFRKQKTKVGSTFSDYLNILFGVPQGSIAGPLFFNVYTCDMFFQIDTSEFSSYADDNTPFASAQNHEKLIKSLQSTLNGVFEWYQENYFKANADKCHLFLSPFSNKEMTIANYKIASSNSEELLGVVIDSEVTFVKHIENLCRKTNQKLHALARVASFMTLEKRRLVMKTFVFSQFNYYLLVWICHSRQLNHKLNRLLERVLRIVCNDKC